MKLLVISAAYPPHRSGEATNAYFLCQRLAGQGVDVHLLTSMGCAAENSPGITVYPVMKSWSWLERRRLARVFTECRPDAVLLFYIGWIYRHQFMITFAPTLSKKLLPGIPFVTRFENAMGADASQTSVGARIIRKLMAYKEGMDGIDYSYGTLLRDSDRIIVLSERHATMLAQGRAEVAAKSVLIPPPPNMRVAAGTAESGRVRGGARLGVGEDAFVFSYIGYLHSGKGLEGLLRAFAHVCHEGRNARLVMIGGAIAPESGNPSSYVDTLHELARSLGVSDKVTWTGAYSSDDDDTSFLLRGTDVAVLPFCKGVHMNNSSFASVAAHSLPVITTRADPLEQPFVHGDNVYLCQPESTADLAAAMVTLMNNRELRSD